MIYQLLWRHTDQLFWHCFYRHFDHNGIAIQERFSMAVHRGYISHSVLLSCHGRIGIDHSYGLRWSVCVATLPQHLWSQPVRPQVAAQRPAPLMLCRSGSTNHSNADCIMVNSYNICLLKSFIPSCNTYDTTLSMFSFNILSSWKTIVRKEFCVPFLRTILSTSFHWYFKLNRNNKLLTTRAQSQVVGKSPVSGLAPR